LEEEEEGTDGTQHIAPNRPVAGDRKEL